MLLPLLPPPLLECVDLLPPLRRLDELVLGGFLRLEPEEERDPCEDMMV
jgi:hypothetical protein